MKKIILSLSLGFLSTFTYAQGLDSIIVEKYYVANAADATGSIGKLPEGSVTYRVYADMLPGYKFQAIYGEQDGTVSPPVALHTLLLNTTTTFFNNQDRGKKVAEAISSGNMQDNTVALDSWFSVGAAADDQMGVLKSEDTDGAALITPNTLLKNAPASIGIPLTTQDGMIPGTPESVTFFGLTTEPNIFNATSQVGSSFLTINGAISSLNGSVGPTALNRVLIGQFTTDGIFHFELNIQIGTPTGGTEKYVAKDATGTEIIMSSLIYTSPAPNVAPTVSITAPATATSYTVGGVVNIAATAADADGTVDSVQFFLDGVKIGKDVSSPYTYTVAASAVGTHTLTAVATDNDGATTTSAAVTYVIGSTANTPPTVSITAPASAASYTVGGVVDIAATAADADGTVDSVEFFIDGIKIGKDVSSPYTLGVTSAVGTHTLTAVATDNTGAHTTSAAVSFTVSPATGIKEINATAQAFLVYPNPASDLVTIEINTTKQGSASYVIYNLTGTQVMSNKLGNMKEQINISSLTSGLYFIEISMNGAVSTHKLIVE
jgi:hypothetical protein